jgi:hypothetical protein
MASGVDDRVDTGAVGQAGVHHRLGLVDATADLAHDLVDDASQVRLVHEAGAGRFSTLPERSTNTRSGPLTMTSVTSSSFSSRSIGP